MIPNLSQTLLTMKFALEWEPRIVHRPDPIILLVYNPSIHITQRGPTAPQHPEAPILTSSHTPECEHRLPSGRTSCWRCHFWIPLWPHFPCLENGGHALHFSGLLWGLEIRYIKQSLVKSKCFITGSSHYFLNYCDHLCIFVHSLDHHEILIGKNFP